MPYASESRYPPPHPLSNALRVSFGLVAFCIVLLAVATGAKVWADSSAAAANDSLQLSIAAPVQMRAELDPGSGAVSIGSSEVQNNGTSDVLMDSAAFKGAEGVSGTWTVDVAGASAVLGADGVSGSLGDAEVSRGSSSPLTMSTTFSGFSAGKMVDKSLGLLTLTFKEKIETFAVYSDDDKSLTFYRRGGKPRAGDAFCGKTATEVYEGFEKEHYVFETEGSKHVPWFDVRKQVKTVSVADDGIRPWYVHAWFAQMESLTSCDIANLDTSQCTVFYDMFNGCSSLESLDLTHMDTSSAIYMGYMLKNCPKLKSVDVSSFDTSRCQDLSILFSGCTELAEIKGLGNWDTSACRWMNLMFNGCKSLTEIDGLENWDVRSVETMESMFELCENLRRVDVSRFEGASLASAHAMFYHCCSLKTLDVSSLVTGACTDIICMFDGCTGLGSIQGLDKWDVSNVSKCHQAFYYCCSMQAIDVGNWRISPSGTIQAMFYRCSAVRELDLSGFDTSTATSAWGLFDGDSSLKKITFGAGWKWVGTTGYLPEPSADRIDGADGKWYDATTGDAFAPAEVPNGAGTYVAVNPKAAFAVYSADDGSLDFYKRMSVPAAGDTFEGKTVTEVYTGFEQDVYTGNWPDYNCPWKAISYNVKSVTVVDGIRPKSMAWWFTRFSYCLTFNGLEKIDTSRCISLDRVFSQCRVAGFSGLESWDTSNVASIACIFDGCVDLTSIPGIEGWDVSNVENIEQAFYNCQALQQLNLANWNVAPKGNIQATFANCYVLEELDLSGFDLRNITYSRILFQGDAHLRKVTLGPNWKWLGNDGFLPTPSAESIDGADGKWYAASDGAAYSPADIPAGKADTYYAVAPSAFAVYSADDGSLDFYNRSGKPAIGDTWQGKSVDGVYAGFETARYDYDATKLITDGLDTACSTPWYSIKDAIKRVSVVDAGIKAASLRCWFANMLNVETVDIGKLEPAAPVDCTWLFINCRKMTSASLPDGLAPSTMADLFYACMNLADDGLSMPNFDMSSCKRSFAAFAACCSLTTIPGIEHWDVSSVCDFGDMFMGAYALSIDLSDWDVSASDSGSSTPRNFNVDAPGIILPKAWQPTAFAVFSADDGSLDFYKRELAKMPKAGDAFEGKIVTEVYTGFEHETYTITGYDPSLGNWQKLIANTPWFEVRDSVTSIRAVDAGISPINLTNYFYRFEKVRAIDFAQVDLSRTISIHGAFCCDCKVESINLPGITAALTDAGSAFAACYSLRTVSLGPSDFSGVSSFFHMFMGAGSLALDCSDWNVRKDAGHDKFNLNAPGVILPSAWLTAAAAANTASETAASSAISVSSDNTPAKNPSCDHRPAATTARAEDPAADGELPKGAESEQEPQNTEKEKRRDMGRTIHCPEAQR